MEPVENKTAGSGGLSLFFFNGDGEVLEFGLKNPLG